MAFALLGEHRGPLPQYQSRNLYGYIKLVASADGQTLVWDFQWVSMSGQTARGRATSTRLTPAPAGAHKISGTWQTTITPTSENQMTVTYASTPDGLTMSDPMGESFDAKFDGKDYPYKGDPAVTHVS